MTYYNWVIRVPANDNVPAFFTCFDEAISYARTLPEGLEYEIEIAYADEIPLGDDGENTATLEIA